MKDGKSYEKPLKGRRYHGVKGFAMKPIRLEDMCQRVRIMAIKAGRTVVSRNSTCLCGSGKRFKRCCMKAVV